MPAACARAAFASLTAGGAQVGSKGNGKFRDECSNENWFLDVTDVLEKIEIWRATTTKCDRTRHSALGYLTPTEFAISAASPGGERAVNGLALENQKVVSY